MEKNETHNHTSVKKAICVIIILLSMTLTACGPRAARALFNTAIVVAAVVGTAYVLSHHDNHYHSHHCHCDRRWHDGHYVYYYQDRWEYYDYEQGVWYAYD